MSKPPEPKMSREAWQLYTTVTCALEIENSDSVFIADIRLVRRAKLQHKELPAALRELHAAELICTRQSRHGCTFWLPPLKSN
jgi:hypothetical protein